MATPSKSGPETILPERAPSLGLVLRHFLTGIFFLYGLLAVAIFYAPMFVADYLHNPVTLAITHLFTLGFAGSVAHGALYQITPVLLHAHLGSERLANWHHGLHVAGVISMVAGFLESEAVWVIVGGSLVVVGFSLLLINGIQTIRAIERWNWHGAFMAVAIGFYLSTLVFGLMLAYNQYSGFMGEVEGPPMVTHLVLGLVGWFSLLIMGIGMKLIPMFAPAKPLPPRYVAAVGWTMTGGLFLFLIGLWIDVLLLWTGAALMTFAALAYTGCICYAGWHRRSGPVDFSLIFGISAAVLFGGLSLAAVAGMLGLWSDRGLQTGLTFLFAMGWIGGMILGMLLRILPFVVWLYRFRHRQFKQEKIPFLHEMHDRTLGWITYFCWFAGVAVIAVALAFSSSLAVIVGAWICLGGLATFTWSVGQVLRHIPPGAPPLFPGRKR